jgi:hypothetical protein
MTVFPDRERTERVFQGMARVLKAYPCATVNQAARIAITEDDAMHGAPPQPHQARNAHCSGD